MVLQTQLVSVIGRSFDGSEWSLPGFGIGMTLAYFHIDGMSPASQMSLIRSKTEVGSGYPRGHIHFNVPYPTIFAILITKTVNCITPNCFDLK